MLYILIEIEKFGQAYQEISNGVVVRYLDTNGVELFKLVPSGQGSWVVDANPPRPAFAVAWDAAAAQAAIDAAAAQAAALLIVTAPI